MLHDIALYKFNIHIHIHRVQKNLGFFKSPTQWVLLGFLDKQEKIGKIIQKLSNLKP